LSHKEVLEAVSKASANLAALLAAFMAMIQDLRHRPG
jgi:hypothetical protein